VFAVARLQVLEGREAARAVRDLEDYSGDSGNATGQYTPTKTGLLLFFIVPCCGLWCTAVELIKGFLQH
jgi:hypothetical protein